MSTLRTFIRSLPGPKSYCKCETLCSQLTIEHVVPKSFIKRAGHTNKAANDLHNIYPCCQKLNGIKSNKLYGKNFILDEKNSYHVGALARACLYMYDEYNLPFDGKTVAMWRILDYNYPPKLFELTRNDKIVELKGTKNHYLSSWLDVIDLEILEQD